MSFRGWMMKQADYTWPDQEAWVAGPGIYFLFDGDALIYIGQSIYPSHRIHEHGHYGKRGAWIGKKFDTAAVLLCPKASLNRVEAALIRWFEPPKNFSDPAGWREYLKRNGWEWQGRVKPPRKPQLVVPSSDDPYGDEVYLLYGELLASVFYLAGRKMRQGRPVAAEAVA